MTTLKEALVRSQFGCDARTIVFRLKRSSVASYPRNLKNLKKRRTDYWPVSDEKLHPGKGQSIVLLIDHPQQMGVVKVYAGVFSCEGDSGEDGKVLLVEEDFEEIAVTPEKGISVFMGKPFASGNRPNYPFATDEQRVKTPSKPTVETRRQAYEALGRMVLRESWHRENHNVFRNRVWTMWEGRCAVTGAHCNGVLIASHIKPWADSSETQRTSEHNGLLLSAGIDALFDRGLIGFNADGGIVISSELDKDTLKVFGIRPAMKLRTDCFPSQIIPDSMEQFLNWHLENCLQ